MLKTIILFLVTLPIPLAAAYEKARKERITAVTPEAKKMANSGFHYIIASLVWLMIFILASPLISFFVR